MKTKSIVYILILTILIIILPFSDSIYAQDLPNTNLYYMQRGPAVKEVQIALNKLAYKLSVDGSYGPATRAAVLNFQKKYPNLRNDGLYGPKTRAVLMKTLGITTTTKTTSNTGKIAYLTFDDGPSKTVTPEILKVLDRYNIKATFFVLGSMAEASPSLITQIKSKGHSIGHHSYSHKYKYIYSSTANFFGEINRTDKIFKNILGKNFNTHLLRFPGGSFENYKKPFRNMAISKGYRVFDWNALNGDSEARNVPASKLLSRLKETSKGKKELIVLMHDTYGKETTAKSLPSIIDYLISQGYSFRAISE